MNHLEINVSQTPFINLYKVMGYGDAAMFGTEGLCHGVIMSWLEAGILDEEDIFNAREERIKRYTSDDLKNIRQKISGEIPLQYDGSDSEIVDLLAYYNRLEMYMFPMKHSSLLNEKYGQNDFEKISELAASDKIQERGGLKKIYSESVIYDQQEIVNYLNELGDAFERATQSGSASKETIGIVVHNMNHAVGLTYKPGFGWKFKDTNEDIPVTYQAAQDIAAKLVSRYKAANPQNRTVYTGMSFSVVVTGNHPNLIQLTENLEQVRKGHNIADMASRRETVNLAWLAARNGDVDTIRTLNEMAVSNTATVNFNDVDSIGNTPAHVAAQNGHAETVLALRSAGADLHIKNQAGSTPVRLAVATGQLGVLKTLQENGINLDDDQENGITPLHAAASFGQVEVIEYLLKNGGDINKKSKANFAALDYAIASGQADAVRALIQAGADINCVNANGFPPFYSAIETVNIDVIKVFIEAGVDLNAVLENGKATPLILAALKGQAEVVTALIKAGCKPDLALPNGITPVFYAAQTGHVNVIKALFKYDATLDTPFVSSVNSLRNFAKKHDIFVNAKMAIIVDRHMKAGEAEDAIKIQPYEIAWIMGHKDVLEEMLRSKPDLNAVTDGIFAPENSFKAGGPEYFFKLMNQVPPDQRLEILKTFDDSDGITAIHDFVQHSNDLHQIKDLMELIPEDQRLEALKVCDTGKQPVIHAAVAANKPGVLEILFNSLTDAQKSEVLQVPNRYGATLLQAAPDQLQSLQVKETVVSGQQSPVSQQTEPEITSTFQHIKARFNGIKNSGDNEKQHPIITEISAMIERLKTTENVWYMKSSTSKIRALEELQALIKDPGKCLDFNPENYEDIVNYWRGCKSSSDPGLTNFQVIDARRGILSSTATTEIESLIAKYGEVSLPELAQDHNIRLSN